MRCATLPSEARSRWTRRRRYFRSAPRTRRGLRASERQPSASDPVTACVAGERSGGTERSAAVQRTAGDRRPRRGAPAARRAAGRSTVTGDRRRWSPPSMVPRCGWRSSSRRRRQRAASTSPRSPTTCRASCAGTSASRCTRWPRSSWSPRFVVTVRSAGTSARSPRSARSISTYHYLVEWRPSLEGGACGIGPSCADIWFRELGFATLAFMALSGFIAILVLVVPPPVKEPS